ncbi:MAG: acyl-CoA dehydrogenase family protein [Cyanobacteria bacterium P01_C01_bin.147]
MQTVNSAQTYDVFVRDYLTVAQEVAAAIAAAAVGYDIEGGLPTAEVARLKASGLLLLPIPREYGGVGTSWPGLYKVVQILAGASGSIGQIYANHIGLVNAAVPLGRPGQAKQAYQVTTQQNLLWANALNARDARLKIEAVADGYRVDGVKSFGTGVAVGDVNVIGAMMDDSEVPVVFTVPGDRPGLTYNYDWHNMGQRRTVSGSYFFNDVFVSPDEIVGPPADVTSAFPALIFSVAQLAKVYTYLGIAEGALNAAKDYTLTQARPWQSAGVDAASQDPYILQQYGELWAELQAAIALADRAATQVQWGWNKGTDLTFDDRGEVAIAIAAAKIQAIKAGLKVTNDIFEVMGARATSSRYGFDRYWRDLRTFSLHDPRAYKSREVGNWFLNQEYPVPGQYS